MKKVVLFSFILSSVGMGLLMWPHHPSAIDLDEEDLAPVYRQPASQESPGNPVSFPAKKSTHAGMPNRDAFETVASGSPAQSRPDSTLISRPTEQKDESPEMKIRAWADKSPKEAAEFAAHIEDPAARQAALEQAAISWAEQNLPGATNWAASLPEGQIKEAVSRDIAYEAARTNATMALELAADLSANTERDDLLIHAVRQWANTDPHNATTWAQQVQDEKLRAQLLGAISTVAAAANGPEAASLVGQSIPAGMEQQKAAVRVAKQWGQADPAAAAQWVEQFPESLARTAAVQLVASVWREKDPAAASQWLQKLTGSAAVAVQ